MSWPLMGSPFQHPSSGTLHLLLPAPSLETLSPAITYLDSAATQRSTVLPREATSPRRWVSLQPLALQRKAQGHKGLALSPPLPSPYPWLSKLLPEHILLRGLFLEKCLWSATATGSFFLAVPQGMLYLSSPTTGRTSTSCSGSVES